MKQYEFDVSKVTNSLIDWIREYSVQSKMMGAILGISGGKDSTIVAKLLCEALGKDRVFGILMPNGIQSDIQDSHRVCEYLEIPNHTLDISPIYNAFFKVVEKDPELFQRGANIISTSAAINIPPRIRMSVLYALGQSCGYRVCGTGNLSERFTGYCTKHGDTACDFNPIGTLTSVEVVQIGDYLGLPYDLVHKTPSDGLCGQSDEEKLGVSYEEIHTYLRYHECNEYVGNKLVELNKRAQHKLDPTPMFQFII